ncbi:MAG: MGMT family protein, partial [Proteobacteria bacterium]|nr:MGMT family protein [Pseudomonadota bacterium]
IDLVEVGPFHRRVYAAARSIGWGHTASYGELARQAGSLGAARAVGHALSRNPIAIIIPCHRILASGGKIGGFSAHGGTFAKVRLLSLEGVGVGSDVRVGRGS